MLLVATSLSFQFISFLSLFFFCFFCFFLLLPSLVTNATDGNFWFRARASLATWPMAIISIWSDWTQGRPEKWGKFRVDYFWLWLFLVFCLFGDLVPWAERPEVNLFLFLWFCFVYCCTAVLLCCFALRRRLKIFFFYLFFFYRSCPVVGWLFAYLFLGGVEDWMWLIL